GDDDRLPDFPYSALFLGAKEASRVGRRARFTYLLRLERVYATPEKPDATDVQDFGTLYYEVAADVGVAIGNTILQLLKSNAVALESVGVGTNLVALDRAAPAFDVRDSRHAPEFALNHPILHGAQVAQGVDGSAIFHGTGKGGAEGFVPGQNVGELRGDS